MSFTNTLPGLRIGDSYARVPIIQGGMAVGISLSGLASAVAEAGGIGVIAATGIAMYEPDNKENLLEASRRALRKEIRKAREKTDGVIGVNVMVAFTDYFDQTEVAIEEGADLVFMGAGLPVLRELKRFEPDKKEKFLSKIVPIVSSARAASVIFKSWERQFDRIPVALVVEGPLAGGHLGFRKEQLNDPDFALEVILKEVLDFVQGYRDKYNMEIPVIAAGGIYSGTDIRRFLGLGAAGVQMATRFIATKECDATDRMKQVLLNSRKEDIIIIDSPVGLPGRAIRNNFLEQMLAGGKAPFTCTWRCLKPCKPSEVPYCIALALTNMKNGLEKEGFIFGGANSYRLNEIVPVNELMDTLVKEYMEDEIKGSSAQKAAAHNTFGSANPLQMK